METAVREIRARKDLESNSSTLETGSSTNEMLKTAQNPPANEMKTKATSLDSANSTTKNESPSSSSRKSGSTDPGMSGDEKIESENDGSGGNELENAQKWFADLASKAVLLEIYIIIIQSFCSNKNV